MSNEIKFAAIFAAHVAPQNLRDRGQLVIISLNLIRWPSGNLTQHLQDPCGVCFCEKPFNSWPFHCVFFFRSWLSVPHFHSPRAALAVDDRSKWSPWCYQKPLFFYGEKKKRQTSPWDLTWFCLVEGRISNLKMIGGDCCSLVKSHFPHNVLSNSVDFSTIFPKKIEEKFHTSMMCFVPPIFLPLDLEMLRNINFVKMKR